VGNTELMKWNGLSEKVDRNGWNKVARNNAPKSEARRKGRGVCAKEEETERKLT